MDKRKKRIIGTILVICVLIGLIVYGIYSANTQKINFSSSNEIIEYLQNKKPEQLNFTCSESLYSMLRGNDFEELSRLLLWAQIDHKQAKVSHNDSLRSLSLNDLVYTDIPCEEVLTRETLNRAVASLAPKKDDFYLLCREDFYESMTRNFYLERSLAQNGVRSYSAEYSAHPGVLAVTDIEFFEKPYAVIREMENFAAALREFSAKGADEFYLVLDPDLFVTTVSTPKAMAEVLTTEGISSYKDTIDKAGCTIHFTDVIYEK